MGADRSEWSAVEPSLAREWLHGASAPWWIAGGWALDLHLGRRTRSHADLDVGCFRDDLPALRAALGSRDWELHAAAGGALRKLGPAEAPAAGEHGLWCRPAGASSWQLEILVDERDGADWWFRRAPAVRMPAARLALAAADGTRYLRPEVQLLYKAKGARPKDRADLEAVLPSLGAGALAWLGDALGRAHPGHPWLVDVARRSATISR